MIKFDPNSVDIYDGETPNRLSTLMDSYCLMDYYPSYEEAKTFFIRSFHWTAVCRRASLMKPEEASEYVYQELLADRYPRSEFPDLVETVQGFILMKNDPKVDQYENEACEILRRNGDLS